MIEEHLLEHDRRDRAIQRAASTTPRAHIVALLPRGEVIRNFQYTGTFDRIAEEADLSLIAVVPNAELWENLRARYGDVHRLNEIWERWPVRFAQEILDAAHGRWLWSKAAQERWFFRDVEARGPAAKVKRLAKKALCYPFAWRGGLEALSKFHDLASYRLRTSDHYLDLYRNLQPNLVFNGSHVHSRNAIPAVQAARWLGIPTATFIFSWDNLTSQGRVMPPYDYYFVWNEAIRQQFLDIYRSVAPERVIVTGTPQFDTHFQSQFYWTREEFCERVGADPVRPIVLYSTGMANHMPGEPRIVEGVADILRELCGLERPQLLVRVYPKDRSGRFNELKSRRPDILFPDVPWEPNWLTPRFEDTYLLANTLRHAAVGINVASTVSLELCMFDKPVINVGYNPPGVDIWPVDYRRYYAFDHYRPVVESGAVDVAESEDDMRQLLIMSLTEPSRASGKRAALLKRMFGNTLDGGSGRRIAEQLLSIAERNAG